MIAAICLAILIWGYFGMVIFSKPKYKKRELVCSYELLPIVNDVYAVKTSKNKILCKYIDFEDENKFKIDLLKFDMRIVKMPENQKPTFYLYERKIKNAWLHHPIYSNIYIGILSIPEGSVVSE